MNMPFEVSPIEKEAKSSYLLFSLHVVKRAIPDVRDGLKPVQRRILFAMFKNKLFFEGNFVKSVKVVGEVLGKFHPHGDRAVYDSMVKLAQDFIINHPLITSQGNFGSIDGDEAAEPRYTEVKLSKISMELLRYLDRETVKFTENFDGTEMEPVILPAEIPLILVNGAYGIAVGIMSSIPSHNLSDVIDTSILYLRDNNVSDDALITAIKGPDFMTGGEVFEEGLHNIYKTGNGSFICRGKVKIENDGDERYLVVFEIPHGVKKAVILHEISDLRKTKINEIVEIRDETDRYGIRIVIRLKNNTNEADVVKKLFRYTSLQRSVFVNALLLNDEKLKLMTLRDIIHSFIEHKKDIMKRRMFFNLHKLKNEREQALLEMWCQKNIKDVLSILKESKNKEEMYEKFMSLGLTKEKVDYILQMRLSRISRIEEMNIAQKVTLLSDEINQIQSILNDDILFLQKVEEELLEVKNKYSTARRTAIVSEEKIDLDTIDDFKVIIHVVKDRFLFKSREFPKVTGLKRNGTLLKNFLGVTTKVFLSTEKSFLFLFSNKGRVFVFRPFAFPFFASDEKNLFNLVDTKKICEDQEHIVSYVSVQSNNDKDSLVVVTKYGKISRFTASSLCRSRSGSTFVVPVGDDEIITSFLSGKDDSIFCISKKGKSIIFDTKDIRESGKRVQGVRAMKLLNDEIANSFSCKKGDIIFAFSKLGFAKGLSTENIREIKRGGSGVRFLQLKPNDSVCDAILKNEDSQLFSLLTGKGFLLTSYFDLLSVSKGRGSFGKRVLSKDEEIISAMCS